MTTPIEARLFAERLREYYDDADIPEYASALLQEAESLVTEYAALLEQQQAQQPIAWIVGGALSWHIQSPDYKVPLHLLSGDHPLYLAPQAQPVEQQPVRGPMRMERVKGSTYEEFRKNISPELYAAGDAVLCWVNEGDLCWPCFSPPARPLTDEEIDTITRERFGSNQLGAAVALYREFARAVERKVRP